jgi:hypothetical protein
VPGLGPAYLCAWLSERIVANAQQGDKGRAAAAGGEHQRLAMACELLASPAVLLLDEPTSGLDAAAAYRVAATMRRLARSGGSCRGKGGDARGGAVTELQARCGGAAAEQLAPPPAGQPAPQPDGGGRVVVAALHQPSPDVVALLDQLCVLAGGRVVFLGPPAGLEEALGAAGLGCPARRQPADHLLHCISADFAAAEVGVCGCGGDALGGRREGAGGGGGAIDTLAGVPGRLLLRPAKGPAAAAA